MLARLFQLPGAMVSHDVSLYYCDRAIECFLPPKKRVQWIRDGPASSLSVALVSARIIYEEIKSHVPYNFTSKDSEADPHRHDIYSTLYPTLLEVAAIHSLYSPRSTSIALYLLALAVSTQEQQMNDAQNVLEQLVIVRDALCFRRTARPTICRATGEEAK